MNPNAPYYLLLARRVTHHTGAPWFITPGADRPNTIRFDSSLEARAYARKLKKDAKNRVPLEFKIVPMKNDLPEPL